MNGINRYLTGKTQSRLNVEQDIFLAPMVQEIRLMEGAIRLLARPAQKQSLTADATNGTPAYDWAANRRGFPQRL